MRWASLFLFKVKERASFDVWDGRNNRSKPLTRMIRQPLGTHGSSNRSFFWIRSPGLGVRNGSSSRSSLRFCWRHRKRSRPINLWNSRSFFINLRTKGSRKKKFCWRRIQWEDFPPRFADEIASTELPDELELQAMLLLNKSFQLSFWTLSLKTRNSRLNWASFNSLKCFGLKIH